MPTGYTSMISDGCSFEEFVWSCARAFGANITMRDDPNDAKILEYKPDDYHLNILTEAEKELEEFDKLTDKEIDIQIEKEYQEEIKRIEQRKKEDKLLRKKYEDMLEKVKNWNPPSSDHTKLREFMIEQIESSIEYDCGHYDKESPVVKPSRKQWLIAKNESILNDIKYHKKGYKEECERTEGRNKWNKQLAKSVPQPK